MQACKKTPQTTVYAFDRCVAAAHPCLQIGNSGLTRTTTREVESNMYWSNFRRYDPIQIRNPFLAYSVP